MIFHGFEKLSLIDFDGHTSATVFTGGCNFLCPFCHNGGLVLSAKEAPVYSEEEILSYLKKRVGLLDGLAITGGEPTLNADLPEFIERVKALGYDVKLDSNGTNPKMLKLLISRGLVDYVAMDIKSSPENYPRTVGKPSLDLSAINESIGLIISSGVNHEFRTTAIKEFVSAGDFVKIGEWIAGAKKYVIQRYRDSEGCIEHGFTELTEEEALAGLRAASKKVAVTALRGY